jgi:hypothetical protein
VAVTSAAVKSVDAALSAKVTVEVRLVDGVTVLGDGEIVTVGSVASITIACEPAMLLAPAGTVVDVIALPTVSSTVPIVKLDTDKSAETSPACTV